MSLFGDLAAFARVTEKIAQDPLQCVHPVEESEWNFHLKSKPNPVASAYKTIPELPRNAYGLENLQDLYNAYRRIERGLPPLEQSTPHLKKTLTICGLEIKYAKPSGVPESDSELTDSDGESEFENSPTHDPGQQANDHNLTSQARHTFEEEPGQHSSYTVEDDGIIDAQNVARSEQENHCQGHDRQERADIDGNFTEIETGESFPHDERAVEDSQGVAAGTQLVYEYASTASPDSHRVSRMSTVGTARSRRYSVNVGVQPDVASKDLVADVLELREARRKSSVGMHERRKSMTFDAASVLGFQGAKRSRNGVFVCQVAGRKFELVVEESSQVGDGIAGVQCSAAEIDAAMDVLFADIPDIPEGPPKKDRVDVAIQWTGTDDGDVEANRPRQDPLPPASDSVPMSCEGDDNRINENGRSFGAVPDDPPTEIEEAVDVDLGVTTLPPASDSASILRENDDNRVDEDDHSFGAVPDDSPPELEEVVGVEVGVTSLPAVSDSISTLREDEDNRVDEGDPSFGAVPEDSPGEFEGVVDVGDMGVTSLPETNDTVRMSSAAVAQRTTVLISGGVDVQPEGSDTVQTDTMSKKRKRSKRPRKAATASGKKGTKALGSQRKGTSQRELKRLGLTSVHVPQAEEGHDGGEDGSRLRRSRRRKFPPLQYWKNEKKVYERRMSQLLPTIAKVVVAVEQDSEDESDVSWGSIKKRKVIASRR